ncbi:MAG: AAA family ATPase, partial [bacterium]
QAADQNDEQELSGIARKTLQLQEELKSARENRETYQARLRELEADEQQRAEQLARQLETLQSARRESQDAQRDLFAIEGQESVFQHSEKQLLEQTAKLTAERELLAQKHASAEQDVLAIEAELVELQQREQQLQISHQAIVRQLAEAHAETVKTRAQLESRMAQVAEAILDFKSTEARVNMTEDMVATYEGYGSGVSALLAQRETNGGMYDTVANLLTVEPTYTAAIEAALGEAAQYVVAADRNAAEAAIDYLRENELGSVTFLLLDKIPPASNSPTQSFDQDSGILARANEVVTAPAEFQPLVDFLIGDLLIVADRRTSRRVQAEQTGPAVTLTGEFSSAQHALSGGSGHDDAQLVGREARLTSLREKLAWAEAELARQRFEKAQDERQAAFADQRRSELAETQQRLEREQNEIKVERSNADLRQRHATERRDELAAELAKCESEKKHTAAELEQLRSDHERLSGDSDGRRTDLVSHEEKVAEAERETERLTHLQEEVRSQLIKTRTELNSLEGSITRSEQLLGDLANEAERRKQDRVSREGEVARLEERIEAIRTELEQISASQEELRTEERELDEKQQNLAMSQAEQGELLKAARKERETERNSNESLLVRETELKSRYEETHRQLRLNHNLEPERMELPQPLAEETASEMRTELEESREKRAQMGMVNMLALEEFERESQRQEFLQQQIEDLTQAKDNLRSTITRINGTARKLFIETFEEVRNNFHQLFVELFQGGDADIKLADTDDPLESPILISARPRGKRLLTISQLSGGEKALTAISLLFAIYLVKPSPFCILDEVDAPLDDANVGRFLKLVRTFSERTQFVVITHNKRTMEQCSRLYGVTMQQAGVSQIVSVDFEKLGRDIVPPSMTY